MSLSTKVLGVFTHIQRRRSMDADYPTNLREPQSHEADSGQATPQANFEKFWSTIFRIQCHGYSDILGYK
jgi:hypothetical protein